MMVHVGAEERWARRDMARTSAFETTVIFLAASHLSNSDSCDVKRLLSPWVLLGFI